MAEYHSTFQGKDAYHFDLQAVKALIRVTQKFVGIDPTIVIEVDGGHRIEGTEIELLIEDPYMASRYIKSINISAYARRTSERFVDLALSADGVLGPVRLSVSGDRDATVTARGDLENIIQGCKQWYGSLKIPDRSLGHLMRFGLALIASFFLLWFVFYVFSLSPEKFKDGISYLFFVLLAVILFGSESVEKKMFPPMLFDIGRSAQLVKSSAHWRMVIGVGVLVAGVVGLFVNYLSERWFK